MNTPLASASAITALSAAGLDAPHFLFYGFLPSKSGERQAALRAVQELAAPIVFYESPHRIVACVDDLLAALGGERELTFARELIEHLTEVIIAAAFVLVVAFLIASAIMTAGGGSGEPERDPNEAPILNLVR